MTIYISLPINGRTEPTFESKYAAAQVHASEIIAAIKRHAEYSDAQFVTTFDINPLGEHLTEAAAMGRCIEALLSCDMVYFDRDWRHSRGCTAEFYVAMTYDIQVLKYDL